MAWDTVGFATTLPRGMYLTTDSFETTTPINLYASIAFSNLVTTVCQYEVLKYLSFAVSTLAKCAKIIPVMVWGRIILRKRYTATDFISAGAVTAGCFIFVLDRGALNSDGVVGKVEGNAVGVFNTSDGGGGGGGGGHRHHLVDDVEQMVKEPFKLWFEGIKPHSELHQYVLGSVIMLVYLGFDGFTSTFQQKLFRQYTTSILNQIFFTTCFSSVFSMAWLLASGQLVPVTGFISEHPQALPDIFVLSVASCVSQFAISYTIFCFGAVTLASVMTFRQFLSVVISCFLFGQPLSIVQWFGVLLVLAPVAQRVYQEQRQPEIFADDNNENDDLTGGKSSGGKKNKTFYDSVDESPRPGMGIAGSIFSYQPSSSGGGGGGGRGATRGGRTANLDVDGSRTPEGKRSGRLHGRV